VLSSEEGHEGRGEGMQTLVEGFQRAFATDRVAEEHDHKVDHLIVAEAAASEAHPLSDGRKNIVLPKVLYEQGDFAEPRWS